MNDWINSALKGVAPRIEDNAGRLVQRLVEQQSFDATTDSCNHRRPSGGCRDSARRVLC
ncbi:hypothetical protein HEK616_36940 [Streptomyces nigrescens]|uniref:Uncharacterized protein n=1 Tax=Streptomyces nigrescens TaxID=1920 RepID=A0ABN6QVI3_STRNI|nr:hypothetical protein HEK616_36940 [Streptomyces nigrescens]